MRIVTFFGQPAALEGRRAVILGELHKRPEDWPVVLAILDGLRATGRRLHFHVEYFDARQNAVVQNYLVAPRPDTKGSDYKYPSPDDDRAGVTEAHVRWLLFEKEWPSVYMDGHASTFADSWMHKEELGKIAAIINYANHHAIPLLGFDLPYEKAKHGDFTEWDGARDRWMGMYLASFILHTEPEDMAVVFVGAAHAVMADGAKVGRKSCISRELRNMGHRCVTFVSDFETVMNTVQDQVARRDTHIDDYLLRVVMAKQKCAFCQKETDQPVCAACSGVFGHY